MKLPLLFRVLPDRWKPSLFYRRYNPPAERWHDLFTAAPLKYAPGVTMELVSSDVGHGNIAFTGFYELPLTRRVVAVAKRGGTMVDVGANAGYFSLLWVASNPSNRCIAFEASPRNVELIKRNILRNGFEKRVDLHPLAAGKAPGKLEFDLGPEEQTGWGGFAPEKTATSISVDVVRLDEVIKTLEPIDLLKIDVEGADTWVLRGCERLLIAKRVKEIHFEQNKERLRSLGIGESEAVEYLRSVGYQAVPQSDPDAGIVNWLATPVS